MNCFWFGKYEWLSRTELKVNHFSHIKFNNSAKRYSILDEHANIKLFKFVYNCYLFLSQWKKINLNSSLRVIHQRKKANRSIAKSKRNQNKNCKIPNHNLGAPYPKAKSKKWKIKNRNLKIIVTKAVSKNQWQHIKEKLRISNYLWKMTWKNFSRKT
jgi:hypothetical protein